MQDSCNLNDVIKAYADFIYDLVYNELNFNYECEFTDEFYRFTAKATAAYAIYQIKEFGEYPVEVDMDYIQEALQYFEYEIEDCEVSKIKVSDLDEPIEAMLEELDCYEEFVIVYPFSEGLYLVPLIETDDSYNPSIDNYNAEARDSVSIDGLHPYVSSFSANTFVLDDDRIPGFVCYDNEQDTKIVLMLA